MLQSLQQRPGKDTSHLQRCWQLTMAHQSSVSRMHLMVILLQSGNGFIPGNAGMEISTTVPDPQDIYQNPMRLLNKTN